MEAIIIKAVFELLFCFLIEYVLAEFMKNPSKRKEADLLKHYLKIKHAETLQYQTIGIIKNNRNCI